VEEDRERDDRQQDGQTKGRDDNATAMKAGMEKRDTFHVGPQMKSCVFNGCRDTHGHNDRGEEELPGGRSEWA